MTPVAHQGAWLGTGSGEFQRCGDTVPVRELDGVGDGVTAADGEGADDGAAEGVDDVRLRKLSLVGADADAVGDAECDGEGVGVALELKSAAGE